MSESTPAANPLDDLIGLITRTRFEHLPAEVVERAATFFMDTIGVGIAGNRAPLREELVALSAQWGTATEAAVLGSTLRLPAMSAALVNAYQTHAQEFDCVYEPGVILPMAPLVSAALAHIGRMQAAGRIVSGASLVTALVVGLEVSCTLAAAARSSMKFFRPGITGAFSGLSAILSLEAADTDLARRAYGILYSQICGSMQSHEEGSSMLAMQMGFNARAAITAWDLARAGFSGPVHILDGRFGYFPLFETEGDIAGAWGAIANPWKVTQLSHKPFPSGRVTHGIAHTMLTLRRAEGLAAADIKRVRIEFPPLGFRLVGRPIKPDMTPNYARLCAPYVGACALVRGSAGLADFLHAAVSDPAVVELGTRIETGQFEWPDPNAFFPQRISIERTDGRATVHEVPHAWGHPAMPLSAAENHAKFRDCLAFGGVDPDAPAAGQTAARLIDLAHQDDLAALMAGIAALHP
jgi:2-methylcitrate dehydratase PrpD